MDVKTIIIIAQFAISLGGFVAILLTHGNTLKSHNSRLDSIEDAQPKFITREECNIHLEQLKPIDINSRLVRLETNLSNMGETLTEIKSDIKDIKRGLTK